MNNYHTQMDKQSNNMLNEIAINNQLVPQQMQHFSGTPINKMYHNQNTGDHNNDTSKKSTYPDAQSNQIENDELELSEMPEQKNNQPHLDYKKQYPQTNQPNLSQTSLANQTQNKPMQKINNQLQNVINKQVPQNVTKPIQPTMVNQSISTPVPQTVCKSKTNIAVDYIIIPIILVIIFVLITYPKTSKILRKFLPPMRNLKGFIIRGLILAIAYIVVRLLFNTVRPKN